MARLQINIDVERAEVFIAGVWYTLREVNELLDKLEDILEARDWRTAKEDRAL